VTLSSLPRTEQSGGSIHYERTGSGPTILFVHGVFGDADGWAAQAERLSDRYTCVDPLLRGVVLSEPSLFSLDADAGPAIMGLLGPPSTRRWPQAVRPPRWTRSSR
jgi:pimeloyl-ACP methyl ester carboxylesterase